MARTKFAISQPNFYQLVDNDFDHQDTSSKAMVMPFLGVIEGMEVIDKMATIPPFKTSSAGIPSKHRRTRQQ